MVLKAQDVDVQEANPGEQQGQREVVDKCQQRKHAAPSHDLRGWRANLWDNKLWDED